MMTLPYLSSLINSERELIEPLIPLRKFSYWREMKEKVEYEGREMH